MAGSDASRTERFAFFGLIVCLLASLTYLVHPWYDPTNDAAMYIATARSFLAGEGITLLGEPFRIRPPGMSVLIAPLLAIFGTDFLALNIFVGLWGVAAALFLYLFLKPHAGWPVAWVSALVLYWNPGFQTLCTQVMSDVPGVALFLGCLLIERRIAKRESPFPHFLLGAFIALSALVRSITIFLIPAILLTRALGKKASWNSYLRLAGFFVLGASLIQVPWSIRNRTQAPEPPALQTMLYSYSTGMWHENPGDPNSPRLPISEVLGRFPERSKEIAATLGSRLGVRGKELTPTLLQTGITLLFLAALASAWWRRREAAYPFCFFALALVSIYFDFATRLLLPVFVVAFAAFADGLKAASSRLIGHKGSNVLVCVTLLALGTLDVSPRQNWPNIRKAHRQLKQLATGYEQNITDDDIIASFRGWHYSVFLERPIYSLQFGFLREGGPSGAEELIDRYGINKVLLSPNVALENHFVPYFQSKYPVKSRGAALVFDVR